MDNDLGSMCLVHDTEVPSVSSPDFDFRSLPLCDASQKLLAEFYEYVKKNGVVPKTKGKLLQPAQPNAFCLERPKVDWAVAEAQARLLSKKAREIARGQDVLYHGTRYRESILKSGFLKAFQAVSFTRSPEVAAYWAASVPRDDDEGAGAILVFDRASLRTRYRLECHADGWARIDEFEERVRARNVEIAPHLIGLVTASMASLSPKARNVKRERELWLSEETADCSCGSRWRTCSDCRAERAEKTAEQLERAYPGISQMWRDSDP